MISVDFNGDSHRYQGKLYRNDPDHSRIVMSAESFLNLGGTTDMRVRPKHLLRASFFVCFVK